MSALMLVFGSTQDTWISWNISPTFLSLCKFINVCCDGRCWLRTSNAAAIWCGWRCIRRKRMTDRWLSKALAPCATFESRSASRVACDMIFDLQAFAVNERQIDSLPVMNGVQYRLYWRQPAIACTAEKHLFMSKYVNTRPIRTLTFKLHACGFLLRNRYFSSFEFKCGDFSACFDKEKLRCVCS